MLQIRKYVNIFLLMISRFNSFNKTVPPEVGLSTLAWGNMKRVCECAKHLLHDWVEHHKQLLK